MFEDIPHSAVIVLAGVAGSGKSTWARERFPGSFVLSSDSMRGVLTDDEEHHECSRDAFEMLEALADLRLKYGRRVIIDATNLRRPARAPWLKLARKHRVPAVLVVFDLPAEICAQRQRGRTRKVPLHVIQRQHEAMQVLPQEVLEEGWDAIGRLHVGLGEVVGGPLKFEVVRGFTKQRVMPLGSFAVRVHHAGLDVIGDVHGCIEELRELLGRLGWREDGRGRWGHPDDRLLIFVGDLTDRGPDSLGVLGLVATLVEQEKALIILGNHDDKLLRYLEGRNVQAQHGLETTVAELTQLDRANFETLRHRAMELLSSAPLFALCDPQADTSRMFSERLVVSHAAWRTDMLGRSAERARSYCIYGPTTGRTVDGMPERLDWTRDYPAHAPLCVHGHTAFDGPVEERNNTLCLDTGCVFGGHLSALRWPSREIVQVKARRVYCVKSRPLQERPVLLPPPISEEPALEAIAAATLGVGPESAFELRIDALLASLFVNPAHILQSVDTDPLLLRKVPAGLGELGVRLANASRELFSPQQPHHLYAKGLVYRREPWAVLSVPYLKMYNYGERDDARKLANALAAREDITVRFNEKLDGTMVQSFSTAGRDLGEPRVVLTTRGMIEGAAPSESAEGGAGGFDYLGTARRLLGRLAPASLEPEAVAGMTLLWELIHPEARIVTDYGEREEIVLTGALDYRDLPPRYLPRPELEALAARLRCPITPELPIEGATLDARLQQLEAYLNGTDREGAVLTFEGEDSHRRPAVLHRVKVKGADYIRIMRQLTYCTWDRARGILEGHPELQTWDAFRGYLMGLGSDQVPEEVLLAWKVHFDGWVAYVEATTALAERIRAWFGHYCERHPMPERETAPKLYGSWRRDFAHFARAATPELSWVLFLAADGRMAFEGLHVRLKGDRAALEELTSAWEATVPTLESAEQAG